MASDKKMDLDEPVNVDMDPEDALRVLLGNDPRDEEEQQEDEGSDAVSD